MLSVQIQLDINSCLKFPRENKHAETHVENKFEDLVGQKNCKSTKLWIFSSSNCQAKVANAPRHHLVQRHPPSELHRHSLKKIKGVRNRHKRKVASNTWHHFASLAQAASKQVSQAGALSRVIVTSSLLENWAIFYKLLIQSMCPSFVHGEALEGKSQHPPTHT